ncbi:MAG: SdpI family protein, partial [Chitinophagaceae bacterium]
LSATGWKLNVPRLIALGVMILFSILGNYMINIKPNWFVGIRTPWTLSDPTVWRKTHLWGGRLMFIAGIIGFILILILPPPTSAVVVVAAVGIIVCFSFLYSYLLYKKLAEESTEEINH